MATLQTRPTNPGLLPEARHVVLPEGIVSSGLPAVRATLAEIGIDLDAWQQDAARCILAKDCTGLYAADTVALSIPRQVGKTFLIGALVFADCIINPGTTVVWTAHRFKVSRETFNELRALARSPKLAPHIDYDDITTAAGNETIPFRNGSRIVFAARERGAIRGFTKVRRIILDEAQILTENAMSDLAPTMNQAENPQMILMGTPPRPLDSGEVFAGLRDEALSGKSEGLVYIELSARDASNLDDRAGWKEANPSLYKRTPVKAILRLRKLLPDDDFAREALGVWDGAATLRVIDAITWKARADEYSIATDRLTLAVDVNPESSRASVSLAGQRPDEGWHIELDEQRDSVGWVVPWVVKRCENNDIRAVVIDGASAAAELVDEFEKHRIAVTVTTSRDMAQACGTFYRGAVEGWLSHIDQPQMNVALGDARKRPLGDAWAWSKKNSASDITPLVAATLALWGARAPQDKVKRPRRRSGRVVGERRAVVLA